jgi:nicotinamide mononucleotide transporter
MSHWLEYLISPYRDYSLYEIVLESIAALFGLLSVWYARKANIKVYPTGLLSTTIYIYVTLRAGLYADSGINAYYSAMSIYGWIVWSGVRENHIEPPIRKLDAQGWGFSIGLFAISFIALYIVLKNFTDSTVPAIDSFTTATFFVGMWLMARKRIEHWLFWIVGNVVSVPLYIYKGLGITAFQFTIFLILAIQGWNTWKKELKKE